MDEKLAVGTTTKLQLELDMVNGNGASAVRTLSLDNPVTVGAGLSAIQDFKTWLLGQGTTEAAPAFNGAYTFQPSDYVFGGGASSVYIVQNVTAKVVTTTVTEI